MCDGRTRTKSRCDSPAVMLSAKAPSQSTALRRMARSERSRSDDVTLGRRRLAVPLTIRRAVRASALQQTRIGEWEARRRTRWRRPSCKHPHRMEPRLGCCATTLTRQSQTALPFPARATRPNVMMVAVVLCSWALVRDTACRIDTSASTGSLRVACGCRQTSQLDNYSRPRACQATHEARWQPSFRE